MATVRKKAPAKKNTSKKKNSTRKAPAKPKPAPEPAPEPLPEAVAFDTGTSTPDPFGPVEPSADPPQPDEPTDPADDDLPPELVDAPDEPAPAAGLSSAQFEQMAQVVVVVEEAFLRRRFGYELGTLNPTERAAIGQSVAAAAEIWLPAMDPRWMALGAVLLVQVSVFLPRMQAAQAAQVAAAARDDATDVQP